MQARVLDHIALIQAMRSLPQSIRGEGTVAIQESEGHCSRLRLTLEAGRAAAGPSDASPDITCDDKTWAAISDLAPSRAARLGLMEVDRPAALAVLDAFAAGPAPFCEEYF
jgi:hypothetical protein